MPALSEIVSMVAGQVFTTVPVPEGDFSGKTIIVTGANSGLGLEACRHLLRLDVSHLIMACRDVAKGNTAREEILSTNTSNATVEVWQIDMSSFSSVSSFAERCVSDLPRLDTIIANAGIEVKHFALAEGFEQTLTVNVLSTFLLGLLLLPKLQQTGQEHSVEAHFSVIGSAIQIFAPHDQLRQDNLFASLSGEQTADMANRYYLSKLMDTLCVRALAYRASHLPNVVINCVSPGFCDTGLYSRFSPPLYTRVLLKLIGISAEQGSRCLVRGILVGREEGHGRFFSEGLAKEGRAWVGSEEGKAVGERVWSEVLKVLEQVKPGVGDALRA